MGLGFELGLGLGLGLEHGGDRGVLSLGVGVAVADGGVGIRQAGGLR